MKHGGKTFICLLGCVVLAIGAKAITGDPTTVKHAETTPAKASDNNAGDIANPYGAIVERNVFDLKDPPPVTNAPPPEPPSNVKLTGIMTIFGQKQALFMVQKGTHPGKTPEQPASYILSEGQRQEGLEVLEIDPPTKKVKIKNDGVVSTITFEEKVVAAGGGQKDMTPGSPHLGRAGGFTPNMVPNAGGAPLPERTIRNPNMSQFTPQPAAANPGYNPAGVNNTPQGGYLGGGVGSGYNVNQAPAQPAQSPEEQIANLLANQQANPRFPPLPALPGVPGLQNQGQQPEQEQQATQGQQNPASQLPSALRPHFNGSFTPPPPP